MTPAQFEIVAGPRGLSRYAARLVLVEGRGISEAAATVGLSRQGVANAVQRVRNKYKAIKEAGPWN